jgi:small GTP-binding protein
MDTGGQERFNSIVSNYYKIADCCLLVYDVTQKYTFEKIKNFYLKELKEKGGYIRKIILLGNKTDLKDKREVSSKEGADLAQKNKFIFMESSVADNYNVSNAFETLIEMTNVEMKKNNCQRIKMNKNKKNDEKSEKCC